MPGAQTSTPTTTTALTTTSLTTPGSILKTAPRMTPTTTQTPTVISAEKKHAAYALSRRYLLGVAPPPRHADLSEEERECNEANPTSAHDPRRVFLLHHFPAAL